MEEHGIYFGKKNFYDLIRKIGGTWNDSKERPIVCLMKLSSDDPIFWAIPIGNWEHRNEAAQKRILSWENSNPNYFRQHITDVKNYLIAESKQS